MSIDAGRNVKVVVLDQAEITPRPDLVGKWLDDSHYHTLVESDMDLYLPPSCAMDMSNDCARECGNCQTALNEKNIVFKFRKNYFSKEEQDMAYRGLREAATESQNRGLAAGPRGEMLATEGRGGRDWVTPYQQEMLDFLMDDGATLFDDNSIEKMLNV